MKNFNFGAVLCLTRQRDIFIDTTNMNLDCVMNAGNHEN